MPVEEIRKLLATRFFRPFRIHVTDGSHHDVRHRHQCRIFPRSVLVGTAEFDPATPYLNSDDVMIALIHITKLQPLDFSPEPSGNGIAHP